jgi:hypothetical protein
MGCTTFPIKYDIETHFLHSLNCLKLNEIKASSFVDKIQYLQYDHYEHGGKRDRKCLSEDIFNQILDKDIFSVFLINEAPNSKNFPSAERYLFAYFKRLYSEYISSLSSTSSLQLTLIIFSNKKDFNLGNHIYQLTKVLHENLIDSKDIENTFDKVLEKLLCETLYNIVIQPYVTIYLLVVDEKIKNEIKNLIEKEYTKLNLRKFVEEVILPEIGTISQDSLESYFAREKWNPEDLLKKFNSHNS